ncbi:MAG: PAS domain-containing protein, partial [Candidatus Woesearchaeota archaeon]
MAIGAITALLYGLLLYSWGLLTPEKFGTNILRIPFVFIMTAFYGYIVQTFTEEKHQQKLISDDRYRGLFENAYDGIIILKGHKLIIADINREAVNLIGYDKEELIGRGFIDLFPQSEIENLSGFIEELLN